MSATSVADYGVPMNQYDGSATRGFVPGPGSVQQPAQAHVGAKNDGAACERRRPLRDAADKVRTTLQTSPWIKNAMIFFGEMLAAVLVVFVGGLAIGSYITQPFSPAFGFGVAISMVTVVFASWGGVHLNPCHTLAWAIVSTKEQYEGPVLIFVRILGQLGGWFCGALLLLLILSGADLDRVVPQLGAGYTVGAGVVVELVAVFFNTLVFVQVMHGYYEKKVSVVTAALVFGLAFAALQLATFTISGGALNILRWLSTASLAHEFGAEWWIYPVGNVAGMLLAVLVQAVLNYMRTANDTNEMASASNGAKIV